MEKMTNEELNKLLEASTLSLGQICKDLDLDRKHLYLWRTKKFKIGTGWTKILRHYFGIESIKTQK